MEKKISKDNKNEILVKSVFITLGQLLKVADLVHSGGHAKQFLKENIVKVNGLDESRRGRKIYSGDEISFNGKVFKVVVDDYKQP